MVVSSSWRFWVASTQNVSPKTTSWRPVRLIKLAWGAKNLCGSTSRYLWCGNCCLRRRFTSHPQLSVCYEGPRGGDIFEGPGCLEASLVPLGTFVFCESFWLKISISYKRLALLRRCLFVLHDFQLWSNLFSLVIWKDVIQKISSTSFFRSWPFDLPNGGHDSPLKNSRIKHPRKVTNRRTLVSKIEKWMSTSTKYSMGVAPWPPHQRFEAPSKPRGPGGRHGSYPSATEWWDLGGRWSA